MNRKAYGSDLTDTKWAIFAPFIPPAEPGGRPRTTDIREVLNAIFYILRGGCAWRLLLHAFPPWKTVYHYQRAWRRAGLWEHIHSVLRERLRVLAGREAQPSACIIDSQSVKTTERGEEYPTVKALKGFKGRSVLEIVAAHDTDTYRAVYTVRFHDALYVLHAFQKKSKRGIATPKKELDLIQERLAAAEQDYREKQN